MTQSADSVLLTTPTLPADDARLSARIATLRRHGAQEGELDGLLLYNQNAFTPPMAALHLPLPDETFVPTWVHFSEVTREAGTLRALEPYLPQLRFPVRTGMSEDATYLRVARKGGFSAEDQPAWSGLDLVAPETCFLEILPTPAGSLPILFATEREDFERLVQALGRKNEPELLPGSMGALMISGYRNWYRIQCLLAEHGTEQAGYLISRRENVQDRFVLLSRGAYSGVSASAMNMSEQLWTDISHTIRAQHEAAHYFTRRVLGSMRNNIFDELLADYCGLVSAFGTFRAEHLLRFLGLEEFPGYRQGARLENYCRIQALQGSAFQVVCSLVWQAAHTLQSFSQAVRKTDTHAAKAWAHDLLTLTRFSLEELASSDALPRLLETHAVTGCVLTQVPLTEVF